MIGDYDIKSACQKVAGVPEPLDFSECQRARAEVMGGKILVGDRVAPFVEVFQLFLPGCVLCVVVPAI